MLQGSQIHDPVDTAGGKHNYCLAIFAFPQLNAVVILELKAHRFGAAFVPGLGLYAEVVSYLVDFAAVTPVSYTHLDVYKRQAWLCF